MQFNAPRFATIQSLLAQRMAEQPAAFCPGYMKYMPVARAAWYKDFNLGLGINALARGVLNDIPAEQLLYEHTLYPLYELAIPEKQRPFWRAAVMEGTPMGVRLVQALKAEGHVHGAAMRGCHICWGEDYDTYGRAFWRTFHQLPFAKTCPIHAQKLKDRCHFCQVPYLRSHWARMPLHNCRGCRLPPMPGNPPIGVSSVGERSLGPWALGILEAAAEGGVAWRPPATVPVRPGEALPRRLLQSWECETPEELMAQLHCGLRPPSACYQAVFGSRPVALQHALLAHEQLNEGLGMIELGRLCNSDYAAVRIARRKCISQPKRNPLRLVGA